MTLSGDEAYEVGYEKQKGNCMPLISPSTYFPCTDETDPGKQYFVL
jgi:hypothetical protein